MSPGQSKGKIRKLGMGLLLPILLGGFLLVAGCAEDQEEESPPPAEKSLEPFVASDPSEYRKELNLDMRHIIIPMYVYRQHVGELPSTEEGLEALIDGPTRPELFEKFEGPYMVPEKQDLLNDPWGRPYVYRRTDDATQPIDLRSLGPDGVESDDDISYREFPEIADLIR